MYLTMNLFKDKLTICAQSIATVDFSYFLPRTFQVCGKNRASSTVTSLHARLANLSLNKFYIWCCTLSLINGCFSGVNIGILLNALKTT